MAPNAAVVDPPNVETPAPVAPAAPVVPAAAAAPAAPIVAPPAAAAAAPLVAPLAAAPETYELSVPAGAEAWLDPADLAALETSARSKGLTNEQAQAAVADYADELAARSAAYRTATEKDPTYGGAHLAETQTHANRVLDKVRPAGTPQGDALRRTLAKTGMSNHIAVVSFLADLGALMAEDRPSGEGALDSAPADLARRLYPNAKS